MPADMVTHPRDHPWSSQAFSAQGESGPSSAWLTPHREYLRLARNAADRLLFRAAVSNNDLRAIRGCAHKGWALGSERFKEEIERLTQRRTVSKGVGRPWNVADDN